MPASLNKIDSPAKLPGKLEKQENLEKLARRQLIGKFLLGRATSHLLNCNSPKFPDNCKSQKSFQKESKD